MSHTIRWKLANLLGALWHRLDTRHRTIVMSNLERAFGDEYRQDELRAICRGTFVHLACVLLELPILFRLNNSNLDDYITFNGVEHLYKALGKGKGVLMMASHFGNWELMALAGSFRLLSFSVIMRPLDLPALNRLVVRMRRRGGTRTIPKSGSARQILRLLRSGEAIAILVDQNVDWYEGVFVPFFKEIACTSKALATLALRTGAAVISVYNYRQPDGRYQVVFEPEEEIIRTGDATFDVEENTARFNRVIEAYVRRHPDQYFWLHQRWKTRPFLPWPKE